MTDINEIRDAAVRVTVDPPPWTGELITAVSGLLYAIGDGNRWKVRAYAVELAHIINAHAKKVGKP